MRIHYDENTDALYIRFGENKYFESEEIKEGFIIDYDSNGKIVAIEVLDASTVMLPSELSFLSFEVEKSISSRSST